MRASPNPRAERVNVDMKRMERTRTIIDVGSIENSSTSHYTRSLPRYLRCAGIGDRPGEDFEILA